MKQLRYHLAKGVPTVCNMTTNETPDAVNSLKPADSDPKMDLSIESDKPSLMQCAEDNKSTHQPVKTASEVCEQNQSSTDRETFVPAIGSRIEVMWKIEDSGTEQERWWGATVQDCTNETVGQKANGKYCDYKVYVLLYDPYDIFAEETAHVAFIADSALVDLSMVDDENGGVLDWRVEGTTGTQNGDESVGMAEIARDYETVARQVGLAEDADLQALGQFSAHVQGQLAVGYRNFADNVKRMLGELMAQKPEGYVVTEADVHDIFARLRATRAT